ncbi:MAG: hypothetical protein HDR39_02175 [Treponema sp.]|nr:hypothetical protein [Treponema sp.]
MNIYRQLAEGGGYNLPYLVHLYSEDGSAHAYLINDNRDMEYGGHTYSASSFTYSPNIDGDSTLSVEVAEHDGIIDMLEENTSLRFDIVGIFNGDEVLETGSFRHRYGTAEWDGAKLEMKLSKDDRGGMTFPALIFNSYNNRGNN